VASGLVTEVPHHPIYSSVVSCDSVHIIFLMAALKIFIISTADIGNASLCAPNHEKAYAIA
jgi:hypothetical protein